MGEKETQQSVWDWMQNTFPGTDPESPRKSLRAMEELFELCLASGASLGDIEATINRVRNKMFDKGVAFHERNRQPEQIGAEAADVLIVLYGVAQMNGFDLHAEVDRKMAVNRSRKWAVRGDGTGYHIKEGEGGKPIV